MRYFLLFFLSTFLMYSCRDKQEAEHSIGFSKLAPSQSYVHFSNQISESDTLNYFNFPFLYLGGGVSLGDINNDGLPDIYFTGNQVPNKLYLNKGNLIFEDITESAGLAGDDRWYSGTTMIDINQDGWLDIYVCVGGKYGNTSNQLFINQQNNTFLEQAKNYGLDDKSISIQSTFFDYNQDGLLDLFVANYPLVRVSAGNQYYKDKMDANRWEDSGHLYQNMGKGTFKEVTEKAGLRRFGLSLGIIASDFNGDGFPDLYVSNDFNVPDYLYQNNGEGTFTEISQSATQHTSMFGMGIDAADFNNDTWIDLFQLDMTAEDHFRSKTNMASMRPETFYEAVDWGFHYQYMQNTLQLNNGTDAKGIPHFSDISRFAGMATTDWSWGTLFADMDNDGWKDVFITNGIKRDVNNNDVNAQYESANFFGRGENPDFSLMPSTPIANYAFHNREEEGFQELTSEWGLDQKGFSQGFSMADLDQDGDLDIVINNMDEPASLFINQHQNALNNYLKITLRGPSQNPFGVGAHVSIETSEGKQVQELTLTRGYLSSVEPILHFGLGKIKEVKEVRILWPDGAVQVIENVPANQELQVNIEDASIDSKKPPISSSPPFVDVTTPSGIDFQHTEDPFDDFQFEPLLPHRNSRMGPGLAVGDLNQDGLEDFFVGNAAGSPGAMYIQDTTGSFHTVSGPWIADSSFEDTGALLFDADGDSDLDLYVVSGGNDGQVDPYFYQDRLYLQTAEGFVRQDASLPKITGSGLAVVAADYDADGDQDLFIGGRIQAGKYPLPPKSFILRNEGGRDQDLKFQDVTEEVAPELLSAGLVTSALWQDIDQDKKPDLILTGEWMPIRIFKNLGGQFKEKTKEWGFDEQVGWWYSLKAADLNLDGQLDLIGGNLGLNYKYKTTPDAPFQLFSNDFDENDRLDIVLSYDKKGELLPVRGRECSSEQVPALATRFKTYQSFAQANLQDLYGADMLNSSLHLEAHTFESFWIENVNGKAFTWHALPQRAQFSSINSIEVFDYNDDPYPDLLLFGNLYGSEVETPRNDASLGLVLMGKPEAEFEVIPPSESGIFITGEVRALAPIKLGKEQMPAFLIARNNASIKLLKLN